jgi:ATP-dependent exoDNAse (exonuclease V) alpha subunit
MSVSPPLTATQLAIAKAKARLAEITSAKQAQVKLQETALAAKLATSMTIPSLHNQGWIIDSSREWNDQQQSAINSGLAGKSFCLIGAAGTGKTSTLKGLVNSLIANGLLPMIQPGQSTKVLQIGKPGIVLTSFTNMAVRQIAKHFSKDTTTSTVHKLLEFAPVYYEVEKEDGTITKTMRFEPSRHVLNPLPRSLRTIVVDESSMVDTALIDMVVAALPNPEQVQWIFLGDLNQLPPVYGQAILGRKLLELPIVELTTVYRQALLSPIISLATKMKDGNLIPLTDKVIEDAGEHGKLTIHPWGKALHWEDASIKAANFAKAAIRDGVHDIYKDMILVPFNVNFGVQELNRNIANWLAEQRSAKVYEIIAGFNTHYYAVGDKVLVNKREAIITKIQWNRNYAGKRPINADLYKIDRWGGAKKLDHGMTNSQVYAATNGSDDIETILAAMSSTNTVVEDRKAASSHTITVRFINGTDVTAWQETDSVETDEDYEVFTLESAAQVNEMLFSYAITVHKSQGSEWRRVILMLHASHAQMCSRELVYTAITRAAKELYIICEPDRGMKSGTLSKAAKSPRLKGNTLAEKLASLKEKFDQEANEMQESNKGDIT